MAHDLQIAIDCEDVDRLADFWRALLGYRAAEPRDGASRASDTRLVYDPDRSGPLIKLHAVVEPKTTNNRLHVDVLAAGPRTTLEEARPIVDSEVERAVSLGATIVRCFDKATDYFVVMQDPEGNKFCIG